MKQKKVRNITSKGVKGIAFDKDRGIIWDNVYCNAYAIRSGEIKNVRSISYNLSKLAKLYIW